MIPRLLARPSMALLVLLGLLLATECYAGTANGTVTSIALVPTGGPNTAGVAFIYLSNVNGNPPSCDSYDKHRFVVDLNTPGGQAVYSMAMAARLSGAAVAIAGTGDCAVWSDTETVNIMAY